MVKRFDLSLDGSIIITMISVVSTYKNRFQHLSQSLPSYLNQDTEVPFEVILVDYDSPDNIENFLYQFPTGKLKHAKCSGYPGFHISHARNIGARLSKYEYILFTDIDTIFEDTMIDHVSTLASPANYCGAEDSSELFNIINGGLILVNKNAHFSVSGFDERMHGWGYEDVDYKIRLEKLGCSFKEIKSDYYSCIGHSDKERTVYYSMSRQESWQRNKVVSQTKWNNPNHGECSKISITQY